MDSYLLEFLAKVQTLNDRMIDEVIVSRAGPYMRLSKAMDRTIELRELVSATVSKIFSTEKSNEAGVKSMARVLEFTNKALAKGKLQ